MSNEFIKYTEGLIKAHRDSVIRSRRGIATASTEKRDSDDWFQKKQAALFQNAHLYGSAKEDEHEDVSSNYSYAATSVKNGRQKLHKFPTFSVEDVDRTDMCLTPMMFDMQPQPT